MFALDAPSIVVRTIVHTRRLGHRPARFSRPAAAAKHRNGIKIRAVRPYTTKVRITSEQSIRVR